MALPLGKYKHYKGQFYQVIGVAHHSETEEAFVVYIALYETKYGEDSMWIRSLTMFTESVNVDSQCVPRFECVD